MKIEKLKIKELRKLSWRIDWQGKSVYDQLLLINSGRKHDSGWALIYIIGCIDSKPIEIAGCCDHIYFDNSEFLSHSIMTPSIDMYYPSGIVRIYSIEPSIKFEIGMCLSSTEIKLKNARKTEIYTYDDEK